MISGNFVHLSEELLERCRKLGRDRVEAYKHKNSTERSMLGIEKNPHLQARSMMAEVAFCLWCGGDVEKLNWKPVCDGGFDVPLPLLGHLIDIKSTEKGHCLCWPISKNDLYDDKHFHYLVLVKVLEPKCIIVGYVSKDTFKRTHHVAPAGHWLIEGTWFLDANKDELLNPELLNRYRRYVPSDHPLYQDGVRP